MIGSPSMAIIGRIRLGLVVSCPMTTEFVMAAVSGLEVSTKLGS